MRVHSGDLGIDEDLGERRCPPLWLPLVCIRTPELGVAVGPDNRDEDLRSVWHEDLSVLFAVSPDYWLGEGKYGVLLGSVEV